MSEEIEQPEEDFDFTIYGDEVQEEKGLESIKTLERPRITGLRSKFSNGEAELLRLSEINTILSKYSIDVASYSQDINKLWRYYGILDEFWASMKDIFGQTVNDEIKEMRSTCRGLLESAKQGTTIEKKVHNNLLHLRSQIYRLKQLANLGFEVEKTGGGELGKARRAIVE